jgi:F-type H+-transporting ATPase subunit a
MSVIPEAVAYHFGPIPVSLAMTFFVWAVLFVVSLIAVRTFKLVPGRLQNAVEIGFEYVFNLADSVIGPTAYRYYPLFLGLFLFILVSNLLGLIPGLVSSPQP